MNTSRTIRSLAIGMSLLVLPVVAATPAGAATTCPVVYWGSLPKTSELRTMQGLTDIRTGQHPCYDRIVFDVSAGDGGTVGFQVRYDAVFAEGTGNPVPLLGDADLLIIIRAPAYDQATGAPTYDPSTIPDVTGYRTFRQVAYAGSFEGQTSVGLGVRARLPMRAFVLAGPGGGQRLVVDVAHLWGSF